MKHKIKVEGKSASEVIETLCKQYNWRFKNPRVFSVYKEPAVCLVDYNFYDEAGYEYRRWIYMKASADDKYILIYVNKKEFPSFAKEYVDDDVFDFIIGYVNQVVPNAYEVIY